MADLDDGSQGPFYLTPDGRVIDKETRAVANSLSPGEKYLLPLKVMHRLMLLDATLACVQSTVRGNTLLDDARKSVQSLVKEHGG